MEKNNIEFEFSGFKIRTSFGWLDFSRKNGYRLVFNLDLMIEDTNSDGKAEHVQFGITGKRYNRSDKGTDEIFLAADQILAENFEELKVDEVREKWNAEMGIFKTEEEYHTHVIKQKISK